MTFISAIGIDFGTSNSCVSIYNKSCAKVEVIPNADGKFTSPSCVCFSGESMCIGEIALEAVNSVHNFKRLVGLTWETYLANKDICEYFEKSGIKVVKNDNDKYLGIILEPEGRVVSVSYMITMYMKWLIEMASNYTGKTITHAVVTVPAYFSDIQRSIIKQACESNKVEVLRLLNEPTAAALAYTLENQMEVKEENVLVIDCGGGTTDISLLHMDYNDSIYEVVSVHGDNFLGGEDITQNMVRYVMDRYKLSELSPRQMKRIKNACEQVKCQLSHTMTSTMYIDGGTHKDITHQMTRAQFNQINHIFMRH